MRDWLLLLAALAVALYFLLYPDQWRAFMDWFARLL
jgi:hypothetical protein